MYSYNYINPTTGDRAFILFVDERAGLGSSVAFYFFGVR